MLKLKDRECRAKTAVRRGEDQRAEEGVSGGTCGDDSRMMGRVGEQVGNKMIESQSTIMEQ